MATVTQPTTIPVQTHGSLVTSFLPLTTAFNSNPRCTTLFVDEDYADGASMVAFSPWYASIIDDQDVCVPTQAASSYFANSIASESYASVSSSGRETITSMGPFVCPQSWPMLTTTVSDTSSVSDTRVRLTTSKCCPPGYSKNTDEPWSVSWCSSQLTSGFLITFQSWTTTDSSSSGFTAITSTLKNNMFVYAVPLEGMNYGYVTASSTSTGASPANTNGTNPNPANTSAASGSKLSAGAAAGIGVGAAAAAIGLAAVAGMYFLRKRRNKRNQPGMGAPGEGFPQSFYTSGGGGPGGAGGAGMGMAAGAVAGAGAAGVYEAPVGAATPLMSTYDAASSAAGRMSTVSAMSPPMGTASPAPSGSGFDVVKPYDPAAQVYELPPETRHVPVAELDSGEALGRPQAHEMGS